MEKKILLGTVLFIAIVCVVCCILGVAIAYFYPTAYNNLLENSSLKVGTEAPDFEVTTLSGETVRLSQFKGQSVILTIGATWCPDCKKEASLLQKLHEARPELPIIMVDTKESHAVVAEFVAENGITYTVALDPNGKVYSDYQVLAIPTLLLIDDQGVIKARIIERVTQESLDELLLEIGVTP